MGKIDRTAHRAMVIVFEQVEAAAHGAAVAPGLAERAGLIGMEGDIFLKRGIVAVVQDLFEEAIRAFIKLRMLVEFQQLDLPAISHPVIGAGADDLIQFIISQGGDIARYFLNVKILPEAAQLVERAQLIVGGIGQGGAEVGVDFGGIIA